MLRIVAGELGGRRIVAPSGRRTRPTREAVREAWFSALGSRVVDARVADLFAGSGALGIEALSRGARHVDFVERDRRTVGLLRKNVEDLQIESRCEVHRVDVERFLDAAAARGDVYDVVLADPPYDSGWAVRLAGRLRSRPYAEFLCVEHGRDELREEAGVVWRREYGDTGLSFLEPPGTEEVGDAEAPTDREDATGEKPEGQRERA